MVKLSKWDRRKFYSVVYFAAVMIAILGFAFGYLYTTGKVRNDKASEIGSYEAVKTGQDEMQNVQNISNQKPISDNAVFIRKTKYTICGHTITESGPVTKDISSMTEVQFRTAYSDWNIEKFSPDEIVISRELNEKCPEHYIVKEREGKVAVYYQNPVDGVSLKELTNIQTMNLPNEDQKRLKEGIEVNSNQALAELLENFGS